MIKKRFLRGLSYLMITAIGIIMIYPLIWMFFAAFKTNNEINLATSLLPAQFDWSGFVRGWHASGQYTFTDFFKNTFTCGTNCTVYSSVLYNCCLWICKVLF